jgi:MYXO-CTERM domain-containing protein
LSSLDCTGNAETIYMIDFPPNVTVTDPSGAKSCVQYCAYHNTGTYASTNTALIYGVLMDQYSTACSSGCGGNAKQLDNMTETASHELIEAVTDPDVGLIPASAPGYTAPAGWADNNNQCGEIGDICDNNGVGDTITVNGRTWVVQEEWSNKQGKCVSTGTVTPVCTGTNLTNCRKCGCGDNGGACNGATPVCETGSTNVLHGACEQCTSTSNTCATGATCQQSTTAAQDDVCVGGASCTPATACPSGQNCGTAADGCGGILNCGTCTAPQTCGGGGTANVCGCTPATACSGGQNCGTASDGCGGTLTCGTCASPQTCGGGGKANVCGCTPATACPSGQTCGTASDGCGGTLTCGTCAAGETCTGTTCMPSGSSSSSTSSSSSSSGTGGSASSSSSSSGTGGTGGGSSTGGSGTGASSASSSGTGAGIPSQPSQSGGCSCEAAGDANNTSGTSLSALGMLALAGVIRARRRRA